MVLNILAGSTSISYVAPLSSPVPATCSSRPRHWASFSLSYSVNANCANDLRRYRFSGIKVCGDVFSHWSLSSLASVIRRWFQWVTQQSVPVSALPGASYLSQSCGPPDPLLEPSLSAKAVSNQSFPSPDSNTDIF